MSNVTVSPLRRFLLEDEAQPLFSRRSGVALFHAGPRSPHRRSRPEVEANSHYQRLTLSPIEHPEVVVVQLDMEQNHSSSTYAPEFCYC